MKTIWLAVVLVCAACIPAIAQSSTSDYQDGKIVAVNKLPGNAMGGGGTDTAAASSVDEYEISIQVGDTVYVCHYTSNSDQDLSWTNGKEGKVKIKGKTIYVKRTTGKDAKANIVRTTKASTP